MNDCALEIRGLVKAYPPFRLGPLNLNVPRGAIYGLIGPNGAGKTTALDLVLGMGREDAGQIKALGLDHRRDGVAFKQRTAYVSPDLNFQIWGKIERAIRFVRGFYPTWDDAYCRELLQAFQLDPRAPIAWLSFGARTKLSLVLALAHRPELLILDEPTTGLDAVSKQQVFAELLKAVQGGERTVLISSHGLADVERFADHVGLLHHGQLLLEGRMDEVVERFQLAQFFTENGTTISPRDGLLSLRRFGDRWTAVVDQSLGLPAWLQAQGARQLSLTRLTLEDLFVALVKEETPA